MIRGEMMARMTNAEFMEWLAFDRIRPLPDGYWEAAVVASTVANSLGKKKHKLEEFLPRKTSAQKKQSGPQMIALINSVVRSVTHQKKKGT
jgi:hypothetical protein